MSVGQGRGEGGKGWGGEGFLRKSKNYEIYQTDRQTDRNCGS